MRGRARARACVCVSVRLCVCVCVCVCLCVLVCASFSLCARVRPAFRAGVCAPTSRRACVCAARDRACERERVCARVCMCGCALAGMLRDVGLPALALVGLEFASSVWVTEQYGRALFGRYVGLRRIGRIGTPGGVQRATCNVQRATWHSRERTRVASPLSPGDAVAVALLLHVACRLCPEGLRGRRPLCAKMCIAVVAVASAVASAGPVPGQCRANTGPVPGQCRASAMLACPHDTVRSCSAPLAAAGKPSAP